MKILDASMLIILVVGIFLLLGPGLTGYAVFPDEGTMDIAGIVLSGAGIAYNGGKYVHKLFKKFRK